jgi:hypothetical protein
MIMETNLAVMESLRTFYKEVCSSRAFPWIQNCQDDVDEFSTEIKAMVYDLEMHISRGTVLVKISNDRKALVCSSSSRRPKLC